MSERNKKIFPYILDRLSASVSEDTSAEMDMVDDRIAELLRGLPARTLKYNRETEFEPHTINPKMPEVTIFAGASGSGKSTLAHALYYDEEYEGQFEYYTHLEKAKVIIGSVEKGFNPSDKRIMFETLMCSKSDRQYIRDLKAAGCYIRMFFVTTKSPVINASRIARRVILEGRECKFEKVMERYTKSLAGCLALAKYTDEFYLFDNSEDGGEPNLIYKSFDGKDLGLLPILLAMQKH